jgi:hypothetical protein
VPTTDLTEGITGPGARGRKAHRFRT